MPLVFHMPESFGLASVEGYLPRRDMSDVIVSVDVLEASQGVRA